MKALASLPGRWRQLWFAPVDARTVGLMRILLGIIILYTHLSLFVELPHVLGPSSELFAGESTIQWKHFSVYDYIRDADTLYLVHGLLTVPLLMMTVGFGGRISTAAALLVLLSMHHGNTWMLNGGDRLTRLMVLYMLFVPNTFALSVDAWLARRRGRPLPAVVPCTTHRLVQLQIAFMYFASGLDKYDGSTWRNGSATYYAMSFQDLQRLPGTTDWLLANPVFQGFTFLMSWVTVGWELLFGVLALWWPSRMVAMVVGLFIHGGIAATMTVGCFSFITLWGYLAFLRPERLAGWIRRAQDRLGSTAPPVAAAPRPDARRFVALSLDPETEPDAARGDDGP